MSIRRKIFWLRQVLQLRATGVEPVSGIPLTKIPGIEPLGNPHGSWRTPLQHFPEGGRCYSLGVGTDTSFDRALIQKKNAVVFAFDPTPKATAHVAETMSEEPRFQYRPWGVWKENRTMTFYAPQNPAHVSHSIVNLQHTSGGFEAECKTLETIMKDLGHDSIDLLKIDIEGAEYEVLHSLVVTGIRPSMLCVEYDEAHTPLDPAWQERIRRSARELEKEGYRLVAVEPKCNFTFVHESQL